MSHRRKAVVTGAGGFIGQPMVRYLRSLGVSVTGIGRRTFPGSEETVDIELDMRGPSAIDRWLNPKTDLYHLAGSADVRRSVSTPAQDFADNLALTFDTLESARKTGCRILFPSSGSVYDNEAPGPYTETTMLRPSSPYGAAKMAGEAYCHAFTKSYGTDVRIARIFSVFGPGMRRFAIFDFHNRLRQDPGRLVIRGDGNQTRDYLYVIDVVSALEKIMTSGSPAGIYNVGSGQARTMKEVAETIVRAMNLRDTPVLTDGESQPGELLEMYSDPSLLRSLGWAETVSFSRGIEETVAWLKNC